MNALGYLFVMLENNAQNFPTTKQMWLCDLHSLSFYILCLFLFKIFAYFTFGFAKPSWLCLAFLVVVNGV